MKIAILYVALVALLVSEQANAASMRARDSLCRAETTAVTEAHAAAVISPQPLCLLETVVPEGLSRLNGGAREEFELAVDSGASETVVPEDLILSAEVMDGPASRRGVHYESANGVNMPDFWEKKFVDRAKGG